tara:strand:- start:58 stop:1152 length:1095 start_codon:yes stop_codon:yes gene_type:complete
MSKAAELAALIGSGQAQGDKNLIINGAMTVAQRGTSATASTGYNTVDRFSFTVANMDNAAFTYVQSSVAPTGFSKSWRIDCTTAESALAANEYSTFYQPIEAQNLQQISNGSSAAKSLTLSFYVKSNKTGTWGLNLYKPDNTGRQITATYTINSADTWEYKTITFAGDTAGGGIVDDNGVGLYVYWALAAGSDFTSSNSTSWSNYSDAGFLYGHNVNFFDSTANDWAVTGVQLEIGDVATPFEYEDIGTTLAKCQRYYNKTGADAAYSMLGVGFTQTARYAKAQVFFPVEMRTAPTLGQSANNTLTVFSAAASPAFNADAAINNPTTHSTNITCDVSSGLTAGQGMTVMANNSTAAFFEFIAEL